MIYWCVQVQDEVQKQKQEYSKAVERLKGDKAKYNDLQLKGKPAKVEDAKNRFTKSTGKLHRVHNEYVLSLREVVSHQNSYLTRTLPTILDYHQTKFELLGDQCKDILLDYQRMTDYSTEDFCDIFRQIEVSVSKINPDGDTSDFLLEVRLSVIETELSKVTNSLEEKEASLTELSSTVKNLQKYTDEDTKALNLEYISKRKDLENLRREVTEFYAKRDTLQVLCDAIKTPLEATGDNVPSALSINSDSTADVSVSMTAGNPSQKNET
ncbi:hypothetical protein KUTeg_011095 [Tegillarca granosa]|uniref:F-BAR domain-containing protein n=1 Tax=Tegillarca granosa TaxID=220873 RepID=A0ABQ9F652_TEGGR|nr:hypothetical protein KUTeg_011095 [Tegillarca granosa]